MHIGDLKSYLEAEQRLLGVVRGSRYVAGTVTLNIASSGKFSSNRTIGEYASGIRNAEPCPALRPDTREIEGG